MTETPVNEILKEVINYYFAGSQSRFSTKTGLSRQVVNALVAGKNQPSYKVTQQILLTVNRLSPDFLLLGRKPIDRKNEGPVSPKEFFSPDNPFTPAIIEQWEKTHQVNEPGADYALPEEKRLTTGPDDGPVYGRKVVGEYGPAYQAALERIELLERLLAEKERMIQLLEKLVQK